ncbi:hypothetical protein LBMAG42_00150 [Deltaproteobacteria bacterium]|nr:hypothetical protein LBMAG42_00150 [Deltaproteobacteria bacterium]
MRTLPLLLLLACPVDTDTADKDTSTGHGDTDSGADTDTGDTGSGNNTAPTAPVVAITPASPSDTATLRATITADATDAEADPITYRYEWLQNGAVQADLTGDYVIGDRTVEGDTWTLNVYPSDGKAEGAAGTSMATVGNIVPTAPVIHLDPAAPVGGDDLTLVFDTPADDANGDVLTQNIEWYQDGARNSSWDGKSSIDGVYVDGGETFRVVVTVSDGASDPVVVEASVTVTNTPPEITSVAISPTDPSDDDDLTCTARSSDADGGTPTTAYTWYRDGLEATEVGDSRTVAADLTTIGEQWECLVEVSDGFDVVTMTSAAVTIAAPTGYRVTASMEVTVTEDTAGTATATGTAEWDIYSSGRYTANDCDILWSLIASENSSCRGCTYSFGADYTYDSASSSTVTGCASMPMDSVGDISFDMRSYKFNGTLDSPYYSLYGYYGRPGLQLLEYGSGGYSSSYYGYTRGSYYSVTQTTDAYGNTVLNAYSTRYMYY